MKPALTVAFILLIGYLLGVSYPQYGQKVLSQLNG